MKNTIIKVLSVVMAMVFAFGSCLVAVSANDTACDHANATVYGQVEAGCETWGYTLYECPDCDNYFFTADKVNELIPPHCLSEGFEWLDRDTVPATCVAKGYETKTCPVCDTVITKETDDIDPDAHAWDDGKVIEEQTCTGKDVTLYTCTLCDATYTDYGTAAGHNWVADEDKVVAPTCKAEGSMPYHCTDCDATRDVVIAKCGHLYEQRAEKVGTCGVQGWAAGNYCKWCGAHDGNGTGYYPYQEHAVDDNAADTTKKPATCITAGSKTGTCTNCGAKNVTVEIPALGHEWERPGAHEAAITVTAGCLTWGYKLFGCADCAETIVKDKVEPLGHHFVENGDTSPATCTTAGGKTMICDRTWITWDYTTNTYKAMTCDAKDVVADENQPALDHDLLEVTATTPTCTTPGNTAGVTCQRSGCTYTTVVALPAAGHKPVKYICSELGIMDVVCSVCDKFIVVDGVQQEGIYVVLDENAAVSHVWTSTTVTPAGCETNGWVKHTCKYCGYSYQASVAALGHNHEIQKKDANCTETGYYSDKCVTCGKQFAEEFYPTIPTAHVGVKDQVNSVDPTCTKGGKEIGVCELCNLPYEKVLPANGHNYETVEGSDATCTAPGYEDGIQCTVCDDWKVPQKKIEALGHDWEEFDEIPATCLEAGVEAGKECKRCDAAEGLDEIPALNPGHANLTEDHPDENAATCKNGGMYGYDYHGCPFCDYAEIDGFEYAPDHKWLDPITHGVTCTEDGYTETVCENCDEKKIVVTDKAPGHLDKDGNVISSACNRGEIEDDYCVTCKTHIEAKCDWKFENKLPATCIVYEHDIYVCRYCENEKIVVVHDENMMPVLGPCQTVETRDPANTAASFEQAITVTTVCTLCGKEEVKYETYGVQFSTKIVNGTGADVFVNGSKELKVEIYMKGDKVKFNTIFMQYSFKDTALSFVNAKANADIIHNGEFETHLDGDVLVMSFCESNDSNGLGSLELTGEDVLFATLTFKVNNDATKLGTHGPVDLKVGEIIDSASDAEDLLVITAENNAIGGAVDTRVVEVVREDLTQEVYLRGDITKDGMINSHDLVAMRALIANNSNTAIGDVDLDGMVNPRDFNILRQWVLGSLSYPNTSK